MKEKKTIEINLGIGLNMIFPTHTIITLDHQDIKEKYEEYLNFVKTLSEPDYDYLIEDIENSKLREMTFEEFKKKRIKYES